MKGYREHRIPLSADAVAILEAAKATATKPDGLLFPGGRATSTLSDVALSKALHSAAPGYTVHGLRSSFRDWVGENTSFPRELAEASLAHKIKDKAEAAYARGEAVEKRRVLMEAWADYCAGRSAKADNVVQMHQTKIATL
jgi:integrase